MSFPTDAAVRASGIIVNGRQVTITLPAGTLNLGDTIYFTAIPYSASNAQGFEGASIRLSSTRHDFSATKTVYFGANSLTPFNPGTGLAAFEVITGYARPISGGMEAVNNLQIPEGVTILTFAADLYAITGPPLGSAVAAFLVRGSNTGGATTLANLQWQGDGWSMQSATLSESTSGRRYQVYVTGAYGLSVTNDDCRIAGYYIEYTMPSTVNAL